MEHRVSRIGRRERTRHALWRSFRRRSRTCQRDHAAEHVGSEGGVLMASALRVGVPITHRDRLPSSSRYELLVKIASGDIELTSEGRTLAAEEAPERKERLRRRLFELPMLRVTLHSITAASITPGSTAGSSQRRYQGIYGLAAGVVATI